jgi:hypothetical protein
MRLLEWIGGLLLVSLFLLPFVGGANWIGQKIYPTLETDDASRRSAYAFLVRLITYALLFTAIGGTWLLFNSGP